MANADLALEVQDGMTVEGGAGFFSGFDSPTFDAPIGSLYLKTDATRFIKILAGSGGDKWQQDIPTASNTTALVTAVYNNSGALIPKGSVIYISGSHGFLPTIWLAKADSEVTSSTTYGVVVSDISDQGSGSVVHSGLIENLDTHLLTEGSQLYLSPTIAGGYSLTKPSAPNHIVFIGVCTRSHPVFGTIEVSLQNGYQLDELHDVDAILPPDKVILRYNSSTLVWSASSDLTTLENTVSGLKDVAATFYGKPGATGHMHTVYLTWDEASNLMRGVVASVVRNSSSDGTTPHVHSVTITWDATNYQFVAVFATSLLHVHDTTTPNRDIAVILYQLPGQTGHSHNMYLTGQEAIDLMNGTVASVVKDSSSNGTTPHVHSVTITWDSTNYKFNAVVATALLHVHDVISDSPSEGWQILGKTQLTVAANATSIITIPPRTLFRITYIVTGYSGGGIASLRFGTTAGAVDSGNNYNSRFIRAAAGAPNAFTNVATGTTNFLRLASQNIVLGRQYTVNITNFATVRKMCSISTTSEAGAVGVEPTLDFGQGMYANNTAQIIAVQLISTANNLNVGSGFIVEGINLA